MLPAVPFHAVFAVADRQIAGQLAVFAARLQGQAAKGTGLQHVGQRLVAQQRRKVKLHIAVLKHEAGVPALELYLFIALFIGLQDGGMIGVQPRFAVKFIGKQQHRMVAAGHHGHLAVLHLELRQRRVFIVIMGFGYGIEHQSALEPPAVGQRGGRRQGQQQRHAQENGNEPSAFHENPPLIEPLPNNDFQLIDLYRHHNARSCLRPRQSKGQRTRGQPRPYQTAARRNR